MVRQYARSSSADEGKGGVNTGKPLVVVVTKFEILEGVDESDGAEPPHA